MPNRKVSVTLPDELYKKAMNLVKRGVFSNFSDLVRSSLRQEVEIQERQMSHVPSKYRKLVEKIRGGLRGSNLHGLSEGEIIERLRETRDEIYQEYYSR